MIIQCIRKAIYRVRVARYDRAERRDPWTLRMHPDEEEVGYINVAELYSEEEF